MEWHNAGDFSMSASKTTLHFGHKILLLQTCQLSFPTSPPPSYPVRSALLSSCAGCSSRGAQCSGLVLPSNPSHLALPPSHQPLPTIKEVNCKRQLCIASALASGRDRRRRGGLSNPSHLALPPSHQPLPTIKEVNCKRQLCIASALASGRDR